MAQVKEFSVEEKLRSVIALQKIESKLDELGVIKGELPVEVKDLEDELTGLQNRLHRIEEEINGINEFIEQKKLAKKEAEDLLVKYEKQADNVKNNREFEAINKEIEMQQLESKLMDKHIKDALEEIGEKSKGLEGAKKAIANKKAVLDTKQAELEKVTASTEKEEKQYGKLINDAKENVEERLLNSYNRIRKNYRNGLAVVPVERDACGGCFNAVPPQRQSEIKQNKKILICENCGRVLVDNDLFDSVEVKK
jgi:predicted  nucleic acid-binding Zn-ribbon protein